jgi:hypothetical protein
MIKIIQKINQLMKTQILINKIFKIKISVNFSQKLNYLVLIIKNVNKIISQFIMI